MPIHEYPTFQKTYIKLLAFTKDLHYYLFPLTERNLKITFDFKKKGESDNSVQYVFSRSCDTLSTESGPTHIRPWEPHSASQVQAAPALNYACEHLCFVFIDSMHLLAMQDFQMCGVCVCVCVQAGIHGLAALKNEDTGQRGKVYNRGQLIRAETNSSQNERGSYWGVP